MAGGKTFEGCCHGFPIGPDTRSAPRGRRPRNAGGSQGTRPRRQDRASVRSNVRRRVDAQRACRGFADSSDHRGRRNHPLDRSARQRQVRRAALAGQREAVDADFFERPLSELRSDVLRGVTLGFTSLNTAPDDIAVGALGFDPRSCSHSHRRAPTAQNGGRH